MPFAVVVNKQWPDHGWVVAKCEGCGRESTMAVGFVVSEITLKRRLQCAVMMGWDVAPRLICPRCQYKQRTGL